MGHIDDDARSALARSRKEAERLQHDYIGVEHIALGLIPGGTAAHLLQALGAHLEQLRGRLEERAGRGNVPVTIGHLPFTPRAKFALEHAMALAAEMGEGWVTPLHLLLGILDPETGGAAAEVLASVPIEFEAARAEAVRMAGDPDLLARARTFDSQLPGPSFKSSPTPLPVVSFTSRRFTPSFSRSGLVTIVLLLLLAAAVWFVWRWGWLRI